MNISLKHIYLIAFVILLGIIGCTRIKDIPPAHTALIYPVEQNTSKIYQVLDTIYTVQDVVETKYYRQEQIKGIEEDLLGRELSRIETFISPDSLGTNYQFSPSRVWTTYKDDDYAERIEENVRKLMVKFPVYTNIKWNGNLYNNEDPQIFKYGHIDTTVTIKGHTYENCVIVIQNADTTGSINYRYAYEIYAPNVGRIFKFDRARIFDGPPTDPFNADESHTRIEWLIHE